MSEAHWVLDQRLGGPKNPYAVRTLLGGHFVVPLPCKKGVNTGMGNYASALSRLNSLKRRLINDESLRFRYAQTMKMTIEKEYAVPVPGEQLQCDFHTRCASTNLVQLAQFDSSCQKGTTTKESPAMLFKSRRLRSSLQCLDSSDVVYFRGNDLRPASGIVTRQLGRAMMEITDLNGATVHKRHVDRIHFKSSKDQRQKEKRGRQSVAYPISTTDGAA
ncbi:unnamed protein product [Echinostoma caproni]|uniref:FHA domain-containing protein n=1 Tax=Echinostoma caproni TaxID=27848 RepID=A0A183B3K7_9TREM|nr:unnamed protein product [Echinostoma caproni]